MKWKEKLIKNECSQNKMHDCQQKGTAWDVNYDFERRKEAHQFNYLWRVTLKSEGILEWQK